MTGCLGLGFKENSKVTFTGGLAVGYQSQFPPKREDFIRDFLPGGPSHKWGYNPSK